VGGVRHSDADRAFANTMIANQWDVINKGRILDSGLNRDPESTDGEDTDGEETDDDDTDGEETDDTEALTEPCHEHVVADPTADTVERSKGKGIML